MPGPCAALLRRVSQDVKTLPRTIVDGCAAVVTKELKNTVTADTGGDGRLSGMGNAKVSTKTEVVGTSAAIATIRPARRTTGMWVILEDGTEGHDIRARRVRREGGVSTRGTSVKRHRGSEAMRVGDSWKTGPFTVKGAPAKRTWSRAIRKVRPQMERIGRDELAKVVR